MLEKKKIQSKKDKMRMFMLETIKNRIKFFDYGDKITFPSDKDFDDFFNEMEKRSWGILEMNISKDFNKNKSQDIYVLSFKYLVSNYDMHYSSSVRVEYYDPGGGFDDSRVRRDNDVERSEVVPMGRSRTMDFFKKNIERKLNKIWCDKELRGKVLKGSIPNIHEYGKIRSASYNNVIFLDNHSFDGCFYIGIIPWGWIKLNDVSNYAVMYGSNFYDGFCENINRVLNFNLSNDEIKKITRDSRAFFGKMLNTRIRDMCLGIV